MLERDHQQNTDIWCRFTYHLQFWIMTVIFYSWDCSILKHQTMCKSSVVLGLVYKTFVNKHTWETPLLPRKNKLHHYLHNARFFGKLNKVIIPSQPKTHFFRDILPERVPCSRMKRVLMASLLLLLQSMHARAHSSRTNIYIRCSTVLYISKKTSRLRM